MDTGGYLHSHDKKYARIAGGQQEVKCESCDIFAEMHHWDNETRTPLLFKYEMDFPLIWTGLEKKS